MTQIPSLQQREQEYRRLNDEMEQKTAALMQEAEQMLKKHETLLADKGPDTVSRGERETQAPKPMIHESALMAAVDVDLGDDDDLPLTEGANSMRSKFHRRVLLSATERTDATGTEITTEAVSGSNARRSAPPVRPIPLPTEDDLNDDINALPAVAQQMSIEAQLRFFKAKVRVLQEELDRSQHDLALRSRDADSLTTKLQEADEERNRLTRQVANLQQTLTKQKKLTDDNEARATALERTLEAVRRDADSAKRENKKAAGEKSAHEVRLNRALEETEHLRQELAKARAQTRDINSDESKKVEKLTSDVRRLERQRTELIAAFKKSLKLIDVLKRQKLHLEAARLLQFREEEFVRALDWDKQAPVSHAPELPAASAGSRIKVNNVKRPANQSVKATSSANRFQQATLVAEGFAEPQTEDYNIGGGDSDDAI